MRILVDMKIQSYKDWAELKEKLEEQFNHWFNEKMGPEVALIIEADVNARQMYWWERRKRAKPKNFRKCPACSRMQSLTHTCRSCGYTCKKGGSP